MVYLKDAGSLDLVRIRTEWRRPSDAEEEFADLLARGMFRGCDIDHIDCEEDD